MNLPWELDRVNRYCWMKASHCCQGQLSTVPSVNGHLPFATLLLKLSGVRLAGGRCEWEGGVFVEDAEANCTVERRLWYLMMKVLYADGAKANTLGESLVRGEGRGIVFGWRESILG